MLTTRDVRRRFDRAAATFDRTDFLHRLTFDGLTERLTPVAANPATILDLGSATGTGSRALAKMYRKARVISADISLPMLVRSTQARSWFSKISAVQADATRIPLQTGSVNMVFANMLMPWIDDRAAGFAEIARVLQKDGVFVFSTLGPDSLIELRAAWAALDNDGHVNTFADMHDIGDDIVRAGLRDPVLDIDKVTVSYADCGSLFADLTRCGARNCLTSRRPSLTGKRRFARMQERLVEAFAGRPLDFELELIYGHAWGGGPLQSGAEYHLDPAAIGRRRR